MITRYRALAPYVHAWSLVCGVGCDDLPGSPREPSRPALRDEPCDYVPAPRWVLRDKDGERVQALVEPRCGTWPDAESWDRCDPLDPGSAADYPCVRIVDHQGRFINLQYDLASGQLGPCQGGLFADINADSIGGSFLDSKCVGAQYGTPSGNQGAPEFTSARPIYYGLGDLWYVSGEGCLDEVAYWYLNDEKKCVGPLPPERMCPILPVPDWVEGLLANPPYSVGVEYE